jgi:hypothetical protein
MYHYLYSNKDWTLNKLNHDNGYNTYVEGSSTESRSFLQMPAETPLHAEKHHYIPYEVSTKKLGIWRSGDEVQDRLYPVRRV